MKVRTQIKAGPHDTDCPVCFLQRENTGIRSVTPTLTR